MARVKPSTKMASILHKLRWSAEGEWSAHLTPEESELLARLVDDYYQRLSAC